MLLKLIFINCKMPALPVGQQMTQNIQQGVVTVQVLSLIAVSLRSLSLLASVCLLKM